MRILRVRRGFQADHSSSSYLFYAVDHEVSKKGQEIANRFSSSADVDECHARYIKWGERELSSDAFEALLGEHYDVMAEESYGWFTLMIAVPKTPEMEGYLAPFADAQGDNDLGVDVIEYRKRMAVMIYCQFEGDGVNFLDSSYEGDILEELVALLAKIRAELIDGNTYFLTAVAEFYHALDEEDDEEESSDDSATPSFDNMTKPELQQECDQRGIACKKSWTKAQLQEALVASQAARAKGKPRSKGGKPKLSAAAKTIVGQLVSL